ncbi:polymeric immunoglobulin receptor-like isoform 2-T2 [Aulostomus maculatus]
MKMWNLQQLQFAVWSALCCVTSAEDLIRVVGFDGGGAAIACPYAVGYKSYEKYLCRNGCGDNDVLITSTRAGRGRYSIHDDKNKLVFTASISNLSMRDAGTYWCGVTRTGRDIYTEVKLHVEPDTCCEQVTKVEAFEEESVTISCPYKPEEMNNLKYFCRGNQPSTCLQQALIISDDQQKAQYSLHDEKILKRFKVTISSLTLNGSGSYLCGVHRNTGLDSFSGVVLEVKGWCCVNSYTVSGVVGHSATVRCPYQRQHRENRMFFCKGETRNNCTDQKDLRFTLEDDAASSSFLVTIRQLNPSDAGTYWCGSEPRWSVGNYTKTQLSVETSVSTPLVFVMPVAVLLILTFTLAIVYKYKCAKVQEAEVSMDGFKKPTEDETNVSDDYENQEVVTSSKLKVPKHPRTRRHVDTDEDGEGNIYLNVTSEEHYVNQVYMNDR